MGRTSTDTVQRKDLVLGYTSPKPFSARAGNKVNGLHRAIGRANNSSTVSRLSH
ncbi:MAG: hypothetical protein [Bacteriophage sp.]|nr:MAG: hypothetical protein [Bacteriophage sp.]